MFIVAKILKFNVQSQKTISFKGKNFQAIKIYNLETRNFSIFTLQKLLISYCFGYV